MKESSVQKAPVAVPLKLLMLLVIGCSQEKGVTGGIKSEVPGVRSILIEQLRSEIWFHDEKAPEFNDDNELTFITFSEAEWWKAQRMSN